MSAWIHEGKVTWKETVEQGIENAPLAFIKLLSSGSPLSR
jgi:NADPH-dependent curcumin reductase CurA